MSNILITGANGQLGNCMRLLGVKSAQNKYVFTDVAELDITNLAAINKIMSDENIDIVVNCAAYTNVDKAEDDFDKANLLNNKAAENLAVACKQHNATFIHVSTDYVFDGSKNTPYNENDAPKPLGVYGRTKYDGEKSIEAAGCKTLIFRTAWLYSEFGNNYVKTMMRLISERPNLNVVFDQVGTPTYAGDLAQVIFDVIENEKYVGNEGIYHFSNEGVCSWFDFSKEIAKQMHNTSCDIQPCHSSEYPSKVTRPSFSVLDKTKVKKTFNIKVPYWTDSLEVCMSKLKNK